MTQLQQLLRRFLAREIELAELQSGFRRLLAKDEQLAGLAAAWLEAGERDGRLSQTVCQALKDVLVSHVARTNEGPDPRDSGVFQTLTDRDVAKSPSTRFVAAEQQSATPRRRADDQQPAAGAADEEPDTYVREESEVPDGNSTADALGDKLNVGSLIGGRYELLSEVGSGGMGTIYKARDRLRAEAQDRNPYIALKLLSDRFKEHPDSMIALQREVRRAQTLSHPNVITVHEFFRDGPHYYMTMELLNGNPLDVLVKTEFAGGTSLDVAWPIIEGVGNALQFGHEKGIVHSDIKPGNIFVCDDGTVKVLDLGISRPMQVGNVTDSQKTAFDPGVRLGGLTPAYASLEMWWQGTPDPRDDIYALACVSYLLITGSHPYDGLSAREAHERELVPERIEQLSRQQWRAMLNGLAFKREDRSRSVRRFLAELSPQSVVRARRRMAVLSIVLIGAIVLFFGVRQWGIQVEDAAIRDSAPVPPGRMSDIERPTLTEEQLEDLTGLMRLAELRFDEIEDDLTADDLIYLLSSGPNSVVHLTDTVLDVDPGFESALDLRRQSFDLLMRKARAAYQDDDYASAWALSSAANELRLTTITLSGRGGEVLRLQRDICDRAPSVCG